MRQRQFVGILRRRKSRPAEADSLATRCAGDGFGGQVGVGRRASRRGGARGQGDGMPEEIPAVEWVRLHYAFVECWCRPDCRFTAQRTNLFCENSNATSREYCSRRWAVGRVAGQGRVRPAAHRLPRHLGNVTRRGNDTLPGHPAEEESAPQVAGANAVQRLLEFLKFLGPVPCSRSTEAAGQPCRSWNGMTETPTRPVAQSQAPRLPASC